jgi:hypothetical protein
VRAITAVSEALRGLLEAARPAELATVPILLYRAGDFASPPANGVTLYLYRVAINGTTRNLPPRVRGGRRYKPSLPLDLHYLLTPWAGDAGQQHLLLAWAMRAIEDAPILQAGLLNQSGEVFHAEEAVDVIAQPLSPAEMVSIWEFAKAQMQVSMTYVARSVLLDSAVEMDQPAPVRSRGTRSELA